MLTEREIFIFNPTKENLVAALACRSFGAQQLWYDGYQAACRENTSGLVYLRGLVEISNICAKDCYYCGIRKSNNSVERYSMAREDILTAAAMADKNQLGSITIQSGEVKSKEFTDDMESIIRQIRAQFPDLKIVLSLGEQTKETYKAWSKAGADRYLLKIETTSPKLYTKLHPQNSQHSLEKRKKCLEYLKEAGYQVGSGIMVGLPWQSIADIAQDILFFKEIDIDMAGIGPYIEHSQTPLYHEAVENTPSAFVRLIMTLNTIACLRLTMPSINIAAATSLDALNTKGKELAVSAGANVIMLNLTPPQQRESYRLYERAAESLDKNILAELESYGFTIAYGQGGDSKHFTERQK